jgi:hypothetical protein
MVALAAAALCLAGCGSSQVSADEMSALLANAGCTAHTPPLSGTSSTPTPYGLTSETCNRFRWWSIGDKPSGALILLPNGVNGKDFIDSDCNYQNTSNSPNFGVDIAAVENANWVLTFENFGPQGDLRAATKVESLIGGSTVSCSTPNQAPG